MHWHLPLKATSTNHCSVAAWFCCTHIKACMSQIFERAVTWYSSLGKWCKLSKKYSVVLMTISRFTIEQPGTLKNKKKTSFCACSFLLNEIYFPFHLELAVTTQSVADWTCQGELFLKLRKWIYCHLLRIKVMWSLRTFVNPQKAVGTGERVRVMRCDHRKIGPCVAFYLLIMGI